MTSDINGTVVGLQGFAVSSAAPQDGYILVWDAADGYWKPQLPTKLNKQYFTANGTWTCPANVNSVLLIGCGGGGGGGGVSINNLQGCGGGGGALQSTCVVAVEGGTTYTITIGDGGTGGAGQYGADGNDTTFDALAAFCGAGGGARYTPEVGGIAVRMDYYGSGNPDTLVQQIAQGGSGGDPAGPSLIVPRAGNRNSVGGYVGGNPGTDNGNNGGGGGGGAGPQGNGGNGGNASTGTGGTGGNGLNAAANSGAGGGGAAAYGGVAGNNGGDGGSGYLYVIW